MAFQINQDAYKALRSVVAERTNPLIIWCGAGLSVPAGLPDWQGLRTRLLTLLHEKSETLDDEEKRRLSGLARSIEDQPNNWVAFQMLRSGLGITSYRETIREALRPAADVRVPQAYVAIWKLRPAGLLTLNLDRLATRGYAEYSKPSALIEFNSNTVGSYTYVLKGPNQFVYNLHGVVDDSTSWVFTHEEMVALQRHEPYINFVSSLLTTSTVVFLGIGADDVAVGGHLDRLQSHGIDFGSHYWLTDRRDGSTDHWAEQASIRVIRYSNTDGDHGELTEAIDDLISYVSLENTSTLPPVMLRKELPLSELPSPDELLSQPPEVIRVVLNSQAKRILSEENPNAAVEYKRFCRKYDRPIYYAWYTTTTPPDNVLLGYTLEEDIAKGAFGQVYRARNSEGYPVAIKVLLNDIRSDADLLFCFRRGVRSMRILSTRGVKGMVEYREASEIPAFVVMDWIDGANLQQAVESRQLDDWHSILRFGVQLSAILRSAHSLPERVLHRDLRPPNIMLQGFWTSQDWNVVVLDFDLSWHRDAYENSITRGSGTAGYLSPEQVDAVTGISTRHSSVDSFGLGMTFYFVLSRKDPVPNQHKHRDWNQTVIEFARRRECVQWTSVPSRFARLILNATSDQQAKRWDMSQINGELDRLQQAVLAPADVRAPDLIVEEIAARSQTMKNYTWDESRRSAGIEVAEGGNLELIAEESLRQVVFHFARSNVGHEKYSNVPKWNAVAINRAQSILRSQLWVIDEADFGKNSINLRAHLSIDTVVADLGRVVEVVDRVARELRYREP